MKLLAHSREAGSKKKPWRVIDGIQAPDLVDRMRALVMPLLTGTAGRT
jgi:hypothetical protein